MIGEPRIESDADVRAFIQKERELLKRQGEPEAARFDVALFERPVGKEALALLRGLFVPALRNCENMNAQDARKAINRIRELVKTRAIPPEELRDFTIVLSNFGVFAGKYATPVVTPPCVCIVGAGRLFHELVPVLGGVETHRIMPISLTFDHRACTGGEAARFLRALLDDLQRSR